MRRVEYVELRIKVSCGETWVYACTVIGLGFLIVFQNIFCVFILQIVRWLDGCEKTPCHGDGVHCMQKFQDRMLPHS